MERGGYIPSGYKFDPVVLNASLPLEFYEARNALRIAQSEGAEHYASASYQHTVLLMDKTNAYAIDKHVDRKQLIAIARETVQTAEDAREIAVKKIDEEHLAIERQSASDAQALSQAQTDAATRLKNQAQSDTVIAQANAEKAQSDTILAQANAGKAQADLAANQISSAAAVTAAQSDAARAQADLAANQSASAEAISSAHADAEQSRIAAQKAQLNEQQAYSDKAAMRAQLSEQLNKILATRESARGLIVSMSDVLFDTGHYTLKPGAREKLAKVAGILIAYPGLNIEVGGYTDNIGGDDMNMKLSENRAQTVRNYLVEQGVVTGSVNSKGYGNTLPVASNDNAAGRQENRRVELVVSGEAIGTTTNATTGTPL
jgi:outer membrane protein OmpA-like peptidoglycan-associated protein